MTYMFYRQYIGSFFRTNPLTFRPYQVMESYKMTEELNGYQAQMLCGSVWQVLCREVTHPMLYLFNNLHLKYYDLTACFVKNINIITRMLVL